jgi:hypothetical protein
MKKTLTKNKLYHILPSCEIMAGKNALMLGDCTGLRGDCSGLRGDCSGLSGDCSGLFGDCTDLRGNIDYSEITSEERENGVPITDITQ